MQALLSIQHLPSYDLATAKFNEKPQQKPNKIQEVLKEEPEHYKLLRWIANEKEKELWHPDLIRVGTKAHALST